MPGQRHDQVRCLAGGGELAELAADRLDFRRPVQARAPGPAPRAGPAWRPRPGARRPGPGTPRSAAWRPARSSRCGACRRPGGRIKQTGRLQRGQASSSPASGYRAPRRRPARRPRRAAPTGPAPAPRPGAPDRAAPAAARPRPPSGRPADQARCPGRRHRLRPLRAWLRSRTRPSALRTVNVDTPVAAAICRSVLTGRVQLGNPRRQPGRQLRRALRPAVSRDHPGHTAAGRRPVPPPDRGRVHAERLRYLALGRRPQPDQLHRGQPPPRLIAGAPGEGSQPVHDHQPAVFPGKQAHARGDLGRPGRQQRERKLAEHTSHHPPHPTALTLHKFSHTQRIRRRNDTP